MLEALLRRNLEVLERYTRTHEKMPSRFFAPDEAHGQPAAAIAAEKPKPDSAPIFGEDAHETVTHVFYEGVRAPALAGVPAARGAAAPELALDTLSERLEAQSRRYPRVLSADSGSI